MPYVVNAWQGRLPFTVHEFHKRYGPVVRIAPNELAFLDAAAWEDIQGLRPGRRQNTKDIHSYGPLERGEAKNIILARDANHARLRRLYGPAFTPKAVEEQGQMLLKYADLLISRLKQSISTAAVQDVSDWYNFVTFDLTGEFAFNESFHCLDKGGYHFFLNIIFAGVTAGFQIMQLERWSLWTMLK